MERTARVTSCCSLGRDGCDGDARHKRLPVVKVEGWRSVRLRL